MAAVLGDRVSRMVGGELSFRKLYLNLVGWDAGEEVVEFWQRLC